MKKELKVLLRENTWAFEIRGHIPKSFIVYYDYLLS